MRVGVAWAAYPNLPAGELEFLAPDVQYAHCVCGASRGIATAMRAAGIDASWVHGPVRVPDPTDPRPHPGNFAESVRFWGAGGADALFVGEYNWFDAVVGALGGDLPLPVVLWLFDWTPPASFPVQELLRKVAGVAFVRPEAKERFRAEHGEHPRVPYAVLPWAVPDWHHYPPQKPNPYEPGRTHVLYAGRIAEPFLYAPHTDPVSEILRVADALPEAVVHVIAQKQVDGEPWERLLAHPRVDVLPTFQSFGTFQHYYYFADVGIDSGCHDGKVIRSKVWDYLGAGLPTVSRGPFGGAELFTRGGCGKVLPWASSAEDYLAAVREAAKLPRDFRDDVIQYMRSTHSWAATVPTWLPWFHRAVATWREEFRP